MKKLLILQGAQANQAIRHLNLAKPRPATLADAVDGWFKWRKKVSETSAANYLTYLRSWLKTCGSTAIAKINEDHISEWVNAGRKLKSREYRLSVVRSFYDYLAAKGLVAGNPSMLVRIDYNTMSHANKETREVKVFSDHEFRTLVKWLDDEILRATHDFRDRTGTFLLRKLGKDINRLEFWKWAVILSRCTGLRFGDICQLERACFGREFTVWTDKRNRRVVPHIWNMELFDATFKGLTRTGDYVFPVERGVYLNELTRTILPKQFARICRFAGLAGHTFHGLRHTYATECARAGIPTPHIAQSLGHRNLATTRNYIH